MKVTIRGLTPATIAFNTLGIVIRGDSGKNAYPESIAYHIDIVNEDQLTEVNTLVNAGLISIEVEQENSSQNKKVNPERLASPTSTQEVQKEKEPEKEEEKEEKPKAKRGRGRPKGSKNKKKVASKVKKVEKSEKTSNTEEDEESENTEVVVMTASGAIKGKSSNNFAGEIPDNERTAASIEAMKKLEEIETEEEDEDPIDESELDDSEKMGGKAVIGTGGQGAKQVDMKNSILPEAEEIKNKNAFIDKKVATSSDDVKEAFIDDDDDDDFDFLEY